jgi:hypothetical protein
VYLELSPTRLFIYFPPSFSPFTILVAREKLDHAHRLEVALLHTRTALEIADVGLTASVIAADCTACQWVREGSGSGRYTREGNGGHTIGVQVTAGVVEKGARLAVELVAVAGGGAGVVEDAAVVLALFTRQSLVCG